MEALLEKRIKNFLGTISTDEGGYHSDAEMGYDTVSRNVGFLIEVSSLLEKVLKKLSEKELSYLLDSVEEIYPLGFFSFGTEYGTCYGSRQVLGIVKNIHSEYDALEDEEVRISYINALKEFYKIRARFRVIPFLHLIEGDSDGYFPNYTIPYLNQQLKSAKTPQGKLEIIDKELEEAKEHFKEVPSK